MSLKIKDGVNLEELRKFGFKLGKEFAEAGEPCLEGIGYGYQHGWFHKFAMNPYDESSIYYGEDGIPLVQITVRTEHRDIYVDCAPYGTYHIGGSDLDIVLETVAELTQAGLVEVVHEE